VHGSTAGETGSRQTPEEFRQVPEEDAMIDHWLDDIEEQVTAVLKEHGPLSARELGQRLGMSEGSAVSFIGLLASSGQLVIERVGCPGEHGTAETETWRGPREAGAPPEANRRRTRRCVRSTERMAAGSPCHTEWRVRKHGVCRPPAQEWLTAL
jgi:hypothetical protein